MLQIAVVEDSGTDLETLANYLERYKAEKKPDLYIRYYRDALSFINDAQAESDIVLMDILMPDMNGMDAAKIFRERDETACLIFVTNIADFAVEGYQVGAMDYLLKPVEYARFEQTMDKAVKYCASKQHHILSLHTREGQLRLAMSDIYFIRSLKHYVYIMTAEKEYRVRSSMREMEQNLNDAMFFRCDNSYIVNLAYVEQVTKDTAKVVTWDIPVSRMRRKDFMNAFNCYLGELQ